MRISKAERTQSVSDFANALGIKLSYSSATSVSASSLTQQINAKQPVSTSSTQIIDDDEPYNKNRWLVPTLVSIIILLVGIGAYILINNRDIETTDNDDEIIYEAKIEEPEPVEEPFATIVDYAEPQEIHEPTPVVAETPTPTETSSNERQTEQQNATSIVADEPDVIAEFVEPAPAENTYTFVSQQPQFPGGEEALFRHISNNIVYPIKAQENGIQGRVVVQFVVTKTGEVGEVKVIRSKDPDLDKEAIRVVKTLPNFIPGKQNGRPVNVWFTLPINFKLQE